MKPLAWVGDAKREVMSFPDDARREAGHQLWRVQTGRVPDDWKPMRSIGAGVREIRIRDASGAFRIVYIATLPKAVYVLHAFQKDAQDRKARYRPGRGAAQGRLNGAVTMEIEQVANVWDSLTDSPEEAANMTMRSQLLLAVTDVVTGWNLSQGQAAARLGITQPRLNDLLRGRISKFSLDALVNLTARAGLVVRLDVQEVGRAA